MLFRPRRTGRAGPWLEWKVRLFITGAVLGLAGIFLEERFLVWGALAALVAGMVLGLLDQRAGATADGDEDDPEDRAAGDDEGPGAS